jgi:hypothetical protein
VENRIFKAIFEALSTKQVLGKGEEKTDRTW